MTYEEFIHDKLVHIHKTYKILLDKLFSVGVETGELVQLVERDMGPGKDDHVTDQLPSANRSHQVSGRIILRQGGKVTTVTVALRRLLIVGA